MIRKSFLFALLICVLYSCHQKSNIIAKKLPVALLPSPKNIDVGDNALAITNIDFTITSQNDALLPVLRIFQKELETMSGFTPVVSQNQKDAVISFALDTTLQKDAYRITISENIEVTSGSLQAAAMARATLLQLVVTEDNRLLFPELSLEDNPDAQYRGLMIDLARNWHTVENIKKLIDLASFYKINYLQLHFTDDQSYTLPSKKYPRLSTPNRHYSFENLNDLEQYSQTRGVTILPEIDIPGHAKSLVLAYPELFGIEAYEENPNIINMGKEEVYTALDELFSEIIPIFKASPYFHIGGDEARFAQVMNDSHVQSYLKTHHLGDSDVHELYRHFLVRINTLVKKYGKQTCVWEGFAKEGNVKIPKDIIVFEFESLYHLPDDLIEEGYTLVNTSWKPLYVVNHKKWEPKTIYDWNLWRFENWWSRSPATKTPIQLKKTPLIIGSQMCSWEQPQEIEFKSLRKRLPVMAERIWNTEYGLSYPEFMSQLNRTDDVLSRLTHDTSQDSLLIGHNHKEP